MKKLKYPLTLCLITLSIILTVTLLDKSKPRLKTWKEEGGVAPDIKVYEDWASFEKNIITFENISALRNLIEEIPMQGAATEIQAKELRSSIVSLIAGYSIPDFEEYMKFRLPFESGSWVSSVIKLERNVAKQYLPNASELYNSKFERQVFEGWFRYTLIRMGYAPNREPIVDLSRLERGFIQGVSIKNSKFIIYTLSKPPESLSTYVIKNRNYGYWKANPAFIYNPTPSDLLKKHDGLTYAIVMITLKTDLDGIMPQYVSFYWIPSRQKWVPHEYCFPSTVARKNLFAF